MAAIETLDRDITDAMRQKDQTRLVALRMLKAALVNRSVEKGRDLEPAEALQVVGALVKQRRDSIEQFTRGGRLDLADKEAAEIRVLETYLPPALDPAEIEQIVADVIAETGATSAKDFGNVMKAVMTRLSGQHVDGKIVSALVRRKLAGG